MASVIPLLQQRRHLLQFGQRAISRSTGQFSRKGVPAALPAVQRVRSFVADVEKTQKQGNEIGVALKYKVGSQPGPLTGSAADIYVAALEYEGVKWVFGVPGEENLALVDSLRRSNIRLVLTRHEQTAGFMAAAVGRLTGEPGVAISTLGPGATNFSTAIAYAFLGGFPSHFITGQKPVRSSKQGAFQILDVCSHFKDICKFTKSIGDPGQVAPLVRETFRQAKKEKPGPCHLELPEDIGFLRVRKETYLYPKSDARRPTADAKNIRELAELLKASKRPLVIIGSGANRKRIGRQIENIVDKYGIYAISTQMGKGVLSEEHPKYIGCAALSADDFVHAACEHADLVLCLGHDVVEKPPFFMKPNQTPVVAHVNFKTAEVDPVYFPQHETVGDIANSLWQLQQVLDPQPHWEMSFFEHCRATARKHLFEENLHMQSDRFPMNVQRIVRDLRQTLDSCAILSLDNGMYKITVARQYDALQANTVLLDNALATMGGGLPIAMAAKMLYPKTQVVSLSGDGGFMMNCQDLETAVREKLHLVNIILNNGSYGMIKWKQGLDGLDEFGMDFDNCDFVKFAESFGARGHRVKSASDFKMILRKCLDEEAVHVIDVPMDYMSSDKELNEELGPLVEKLRAERLNWPEKQL